VPYLRPYRGVLVLALLALLVAAAAMLALPIALRYLIDNGISSKNSDTINQYFIAFLAAAAIFGVFAALRFYLVSWIGERVVADMRSAVYARVIRMDPAFFEVTRIGEVLSRLTADTTLVQSIAGVNLSITLRSTLSLIGSLVMLASRAKLTRSWCADPGSHRAFDRAGPPRAPAFAHVAGPHRRHQQHRRRNAERRADGAGLHAGADQYQPVRRGGRRLLRRGRAPHQDALHAYGAGHDAGLRRHHVRALDGRARGRTR
jgi:hypothetical protein